MIYYKVLKAGQVYNPKTYKYTSLVVDELLTAKECERIGLWHEWLNTKAACEYLQKIEWSRKKIYWWFGARFAEECNHIEVAGPPRKIIIRPYINKPQQIDNEN